MSTRHWAILWLLCVTTGLSASAGTPPSAAMVASVRPTWTVGDWWIVESQVYDHGDKMPGATEGWLEIERWLFSVVSTNAIDGEPCYEVTIKPKDGNHCPYWFTCWFRMSDLLVLRRELHQPAAARPGRPLAAPVVQANYPKDEEMPFMPSDFPNLPLATPHFAGGVTNVYGPKVSQTRLVAAEGGARKSARSSSARLTQAFHANEKVEPENALPSGRTRPAAPSGTPEKFGVIVLAQSAEKYERQNWNSRVPWHTYGEKWEGGQLVRKSWLADYGHATGGANEAPAGGAR